MIALRSFTRLMVRGVCLEKKIGMDKIYIFWESESESRFGSWEPQSDRDLQKPIGSRESEPPENFSPPYFCFLQINFLQSDLSFMGNKTGRKGTLNSSSFDRDM